MAHKEIDIVRVYLDKSLRVHVVLHEESLFLKDAPERRELIANLLLAITRSFNKASAD